MIQDFNRAWSFYRLDDKVKIVNLPHDAMLEESRSASCHNGDKTGYFPGGKYRYEKNFQIDAEVIGKYVALKFEGVYQHATILINDKKVYYHAYGYTEFIVDISSDIKAGDNTVTVLVDNSLEPNSRWYTGSGIYQPVFLIIKEKEHIEGLKIITKSYEPAVIEVTAKAVDAVVNIYDGERKIAAGTLGEIHLPAAELWNAENPKLYRCVVKTATDSVEQFFGVRKLEWSAETGLLVNGTETLLRGGCIHHDNGILGACAFPDAEERRVSILKEAGYNAIRSAHNPCTRVLLDACDKLGMYVMDEAFDGWYIPKTHHDYARDFEDNYKADLAAMVNKCMNHPCVIMYSIGNEVGETAQEKGIALCGKMTELLHDLDPTRPVTCGINPMLNWLTDKNMGIYKDSGEYKAEPLPPKKEKEKEKKSGSAFYNAIKQKINWLTDVLAGTKKAGKAISASAEKLDILGLNYGSARYDKDLAAFPARMMVGSETLFSDQYYNWERVKKHKALIGDFVWTAWDYLGEACIGDWTYLSYQGLPLTAGCGAIDLIGTIGAESYYQQTIWGLRDKPYIGVRPVSYTRETPVAGRWRFTNAIDSWNWQGYEGKKAVVEVFSDAYAIRLSLNDKEIATKPLRECKVMFTLKYQPGELKAVALDAAGKVLSHSILTTGGGQRMLTATPDKTILHANGQDLCYIPISITDADGNYLPAQDVRIKVEVDGVSVLQGFGSALSKTDEVFINNSHNTYYGRALAVIRAGYVPEVIHVIVSGDGFVPQRFEVAVK